MSKSKSKSQANQAVIHCGNCSKALQAGDWVLVGYIQEADVVTSHMLLCIKCSGEALNDKLYEPAKVERLLAITEQIREAHCIDFANLDNAISDLRGASCIRYPTS
jgi:hypothetical protein